MKENKLPSIISILILTMVTTIMWIGLGVYRAFTVQPAPVVPTAVTQSLTPTLDTNTIDKIQSSIFLDNSQIPENVVAATSTPIPTVAPTPTAIPTPTTATDSGATPVPTP